ncbi:conjugative transfer signal peptidase TraF [Agrobacterium tumefaciens]|uniref:conjugative transfer signal peptidase TraF n=1 Tax=Agrobacterium tumefaciens TaxID=358 RepID=UPI0015720A00|nr:conjugative transfer signal peptidase TraF [Agrobacterium tumefaciens]NTD85696.1 conjugative transfer signal peptidase TraF [Agrobacterium tumefaciens]NTD93970.1 conjugative transfer signal peptidase TraF [Agrobacterium tumefaciens]NTD97120.1 conjugative transfer signal peptidase TraF [Agrobacterium tumefaciens]NTE12486.1 conjugative transfer signal peptidase TraF [Agrobacterium tumefaciens]NTE18431.1 conjugative transfer signal peptidase TraF [Agrobacterium tumefaciens]
MRRRLLLFLAGASGAIAALAAIAYFGGFRLNLTPSEPLGLWRIMALQRPVEVGDLVFICLPATASFEEARRRGYVRSGLCPSGFAPLIKTVAALPGQHVEIGANVTVDGRPLASSIVRASDGEGRPITPFKTGTVPPGNLFLHSSFASSYDSRYFGPVPDTGLLGLARPVLTFHP